MKSTTQRTSQQITTNQQILIVTKFYLGPSCFHAPSFLRCVLRRRTLQRSMSTPEQKSCFSTGPVSWLCQSQNVAICVSQAVAHPGVGHVDRLTGSNPKKKGIIDVQISLVVVGSFPVELVLAIGFEPHSAFSRWHECSAKPSNINSNREGTTCFAESGQQSFPCCLPLPPVEAAILAALRWCLLFTQTTSSVNFALSLTTSERSVCMLSVVVIFSFHAAPPLSIDVFLDSDPDAALRLRDCSFSVIGFHVFFHPLVLEHRPLILHVCFRIRHAFQVCVCSKSLKRVDFRKKSNFFLKKKQTHGSKRHKNLRATTKTKATTIPRTKTFKNLGDGKYAGC